MTLRSPLKYMTSEVQNHIRQNTDGHAETQAKKSGDHYIVSGEKKWITNGIWADFFTTAVRTGGPGAKGVSMLLIERPLADDTGPSVRWPVTSRRRAQDHCGARILSQ